MPPNLQIRFEQKKDKEKRKGEEGWPAGGRPGKTGKLEQQQIPIAGLVI